LLCEADREAVVKLLETAPYYNLYMLGNLETLGFDQTFCEFWGDFDQRDLRGVLNRYMQGWTLFGRDDADWAALARVLDEHPVEARRLQDNPGGAPSLLPYLKRYRASQSTETQLMDLSPEDFASVAAPPGSAVRRADWSDLERLVDFYADAGHMTRSRQAVERPLQDTRVWVAEVNGELAAAALTNAETAKLAMIGGVYTTPAWRNRGLSQAVCSALCAELISLGRRPVLYWEAEAAGAVYRRLGFRARGLWRSVWLEPR
jgi:N-acetylglutamate synthase-like GNAT family acetyltransferase